MQSCPGLESQSQEQRAGRRRQQIIAKCIASTVGPSCRKVWSQRQERVILSVLQPTASLHCSAGQLASGHRPLCFAEKPDEVLRYRSGFIYRQLLQGVQCTTDLRIAACGPLRVWCSSSGNEQCNLKLAVSISQESKTCKQSPTVLHASPQGWRVSCQEAPVRKLILMILEIGIGETHPLAGNGGVLPGRSGSEHCPKVKVGVYHFMPLCEDASLKLPKRT
nr:zinc finger matrin-type protein 4 isoform X3 [Macaca nemestrina]XP_024646967.1 zinc finger matrin-type protein 4 isoform X3 [Macaca nemestrina]